MPAWCGTHTPRMYGIGWFSLSLFNNLSRSSIKAMLDYFDWSLPAALRMRPCSIAEN